MAFHEVFRNIVSIDGLHESISIVATRLCQV